MTKRVINEVQEYLTIFKKKPHGRMSSENIDKAVAEATEKALNEVSESLGVKSLIPEITKINESQKLIAWARESIINDQTSSDSDKQEFKDKCNEHYALLTK